jgi:hypothetical protein
MPCAVTWQMKDMDAGFKKHLAALQKIHSDHNDKVHTDAKKQLEQAELAHNKRIAGMCVRACVRACVRRQCVCVRKSIGIDREMGA